MKVIKSKRKPTLSHFSLIELLVVISIIAVLTAMLMPGVSKARSSARFSRWQGFTHDLRSNTDVILLFNLVTTGETVMENQAVGNPMLTAQLVEQYKGTIAGATWVTNGGRWYGKTTLYFDGTSDRVVCSNFKGILRSLPRAITTWIKTTSVATQYICSWGQASPGNAWALAVSNTGRIMQSCDGGRIEGNRVINDGEWHHVASVFNDDGSANLQDTLLYVDGRLDAQFGGSPAPTHADSVVIDTLDNVSFRIGAYLDNSGEFTGYIDEFILYTTDLTAGEIHGIFEMGRP